MNTVPAIKHDSGYIMSWGCLSSQGIGNPVMVRNIPITWGFLHYVWRLAVALCSWDCRLLLSSCIPTSYMLYIHHVMGSCIHHVKERLLFPGHMELRQVPGNHEKGEMHPDPWWKHETICIEALTRRLLEVPARQRSKTHRLIKRCGTK